MDFLTSPNHANYGFFLKKISVIIKHAGEQGYAITVKQLRNNKETNVGNFFHNVVKIKGSNQKIMGNETFLIANMYVFSN